MREQTGPSMDSDMDDRFRQMKTRVEEIERLVLELKDLGSGMPVVEKNARCLLSFVHCLKFGIVDLPDAVEG